MYEAILCLAMFGQIDLGEDLLLELPAVVKPVRKPAEIDYERRQEIEANRAAWAAKKAAKLQRRREIQVARGRARAYDRRYRIANGLNYPQGYAQQAAAMRSAAAGLHYAAVSRVYGRPRSRNCEQRRGY